jgi:SCY1-like protein 1
MLKESASLLPPEFAAYRVQQALVSVLERGSASTSATSIILSLLQLGKNVPTDEEYVTPVVGPRIEVCG